MYEYKIPEKHHIKIVENPAKLFALSIGILGDLAGESGRNGQPPESTSELRESLFFSAYFFDAYSQSRLNEVLDPYFALLGSASYYLCDLPGSSMVLANRIGQDPPDLGGDGLENLLLWLLQGEVSTYFDVNEGHFDDHIDSISRGIVQFFETGTGSDKFLERSKQLRDLVYQSGSPRQLLLGDVIAAVVIKKHQNSSWNALPIYSDLSSDAWKHALQKDSFIKEFWPAQHLLGQEGVLRGNSAVVQMPTSAGKTKATELIIRSAIIAGRSSVSFIVAPFRALCHEIKNSLVTAFQDEAIKITELTDVMQADFEITELLTDKQIVVVTPEKLLYVLRHTPELAGHIGLLVLDEGHQFDSGTRGITYELLLTSLKSMLPENTQKILISAVISNAEAVGEWLNGDGSTIITGHNLMPTTKSIGFASWRRKLGRIEYVSPENPDKNEFFVPRVIESYELHRKPGESKSKVRLFPDKKSTKNVGKEIALYLGLRLMHQGAVAVFCGRKDTASGLCSMIADRFSRSLPMDKPSDYSDSEELRRLHDLYGQNLGPDASATQSACLGVFSHHGNTPRGIRLAVEYAMREGLIRFVVCTSTLAQGVNLPIRYLIVTSIYQGAARIKVRDFHNLIGRAGRAGIHTEGSILFADPAVYDGRKRGRGRWRWGLIKDLLEPENSEPCISNLLSLFDPFKSDDGKLIITMEALDFANAYVNDPDGIADISGQIVQVHGEKIFSRREIERQISWKLSLISSIESFLLSNWTDANEEFATKDIERLAEDTLAYFLAEEEDREHIRQLFVLLAENIAMRAKDSARRKAYGRTLYGLRNAQAIDEWVQTNIVPLKAAESDDEIVKVVWPILTKNIGSSVFRKCDPPSELEKFCIDWIDGRSFHQLFGVLNDAGVKLIWGTKHRNLNIDNVVDMCEGGLAYDGALLVGALSEFVGLIEDDDIEAVHGRLRLFQKKIKYGLPSETAIVLCEMGFSDRVLAQDLANLIAGSTSIVIKRQLRKNREEIQEVLSRYPSYFRSEVYEKVVLQ